jgi:dTDP-4-dehydrorhamnose 3,5-epimerase
LDYTGGKSGRRREPIGPVRATATLDGSVPSLATSPTAADAGGRTAIDGVTVRTFAPNADIRGDLFEIHRDDWQLAPRPVQWDFVVRAANVLQGVHVHCRRWDYVIVLEGQATIGLRDIRRDQPSFGGVMAVEVSGQEPTVVTIPPGVAHGILARTPLRYLYGLSVAWTGEDDDLGCRYDDPALAIAWPVKSPVVLPRDLALPDFATLLRRYAAAAQPS